MDESKKNIHLENANSFLKNLDKWESPYTGLEKI